MQLSSHIMTQILRGTISFNKLRRLYASGEMVKIMKIIYLAHQIALFAYHKSLKKKLKKQIRIGQADQQKVL